MPSKEYVKVSTPKATELDEEEGVEVRSGLGKATHGNTRWPCRDPCEHDGSRPGTTVADDHFDGRR